MGRYITRLSLYNKVEKLLFCKGVNKDQQGMIFVKNLEFLPSLFFFKKGLDILSDDVLERKQGFLDHI